MGNSIDAMEYSIEVCGSMLEMLHQCTTSIKEIYIPQYNITFNVAKDGFDNNTFNIVKEKRSEQGTGHKKIQLNAEFVNKLRNLAALQDKMAVLKRDILMYEKQNLLYDGTIEAIKYQREISDSFFDAIHGDAYDIDEVYIPRLNLGFNIVQENVNILSSDLSGQGKNRIPIKLNEVFVNKLKEFATEANKLKSIKADLITLSTNVV